MRVAKADFKVSEDGESNRLLLLLCVNVCLILHMRTPSFI